MIQCNAFKKTLQTFVQKMRETLQDFWAGSVMFAKIKIKKDAK